MKVQLVKLALRALACGDEAMNIASVVVLLLVALALVWAVRSSWRRRGHCCGSDCCRCHNRCKHGD